jgi:hypothetical protein
MGELGIDVKEVVVHTVAVLPRLIDIDDFEVGLHDGTPRRKNEGGFFAYDRPFKKELGRDQAQVGFAMPLVDIALLHVDADDGGEPAAIPRREPALHELDALDRVRVEDRIEPEQVGGVVDRHAIQQDKVLVRATTTHVEAGRTISAGMHTWIKLE